MSVVAGDAIGVQRDLIRLKSPTQAFPVFGSHAAKTEQKFSIMVAMRQVVEASRLQIAVGSRQAGE